MISKNHSLNLKAIAIILVIVSHCVGAFGIRYATPLGGIGVSIFLFLSAFGLNESYKKNGIEGFVEKRISKVLIPYIIIVLIDTLIQRNSIDRLLKNLFLIKTPSMMWYVQFILLNYTIFYFVNYLIKKKNIKYLTWGIISVLIFFIGTPLQAEQAIIFLIGILFSDLSYKIKTSKKKMILVVLIFFIIGILSLVIKQLPVIRMGNKPMYYFIELLIKNGIGLSVIFYISFILKFSKKFDSILNNIGKISYELYLVHAVLLYKLKENPNILSLCLFILTTFVGVLVFKRINKKLKLPKLNYGGNI